MRGECGTEAQGGGKCEDDDEVQHTDGQIVAQPQHGADGQDEDLHGDGGTQAGHAQRESTEDGGDRQVGDRGAVTGSRRDHDEGDGGGLGEEDGVAQRQRPRRCRPDLRRHGNGRDESHLAHGHVKVPGDDGHDKDRDKAKASRQSITDVTRGQGLRYAYSASTSDEYSFMTTLRFNFMEGVS